MENYPKTIIYQKTFCIFLRYFLAISIFMIEPSLFGVIAECRNINIARKVGQKRGERLFDFLAAVLLERLLPLAV